MFTPNQKDTYYGQWVRAAVQNYHIEVGYSFTLSEFTKYWGISLTHNLRKRIKSLVHEGTLDCHYALAGDRGSVIVYTRPISEDQFYSDPLCLQ